MDTEPGPDVKQQSLQTQDKEKNQMEDVNLPVAGELKNADTEITTILEEDEQNSKDDNRSHSKERTSSKKNSKAHLEVAGSESDTESSSPNSETKTTKKKRSKVERDVSEEVMRRKETIKALLVSSEILPEEEDSPEEEEEVQEEPPPEPGNSQFKFLKKRCGKLVNLKAWVAPWQGYNMLETAKSWKPVDKWAPTHQFIRYQNKLVVWRHDHPLAQHIGWDRGCLIKYCRRPMISSSWDN